MSLTAEQQVKIAKEEMERIHYEIRHMRELGDILEVWDEPTKKADVVVKKSTVLNWVSKLYYRFVSRFS